MGTPEIAVATLAAVGAAHEVVAVATQPDRGKGRGRNVQVSPVKAWALDNGVAVLQPTTLRTTEALATLAALRPDVIVVVAYGLLLPPSVLELPEMGCVNLHASLLPRHRGASPVQGAILAGDAVTGVTTMLMDEGLDTGPMLLAREVPLRADDTTVSLTERLAQAGAPLVLETLEALADGSLRPTPQDDAAATVTRRIAKADGSIDWQQPAAVTERLVRAMQPWPSATTWLDGTRLQVWRASVVSEPQSSVLPGTVCAHADGIVVACGGGTALRIEQLQRPGGKRLSAADFLRGMPIPLGAKLGVEREIEPDPEPERGR